jgi:hypothetical protein
MTMTKGEVENLQRLVRQREKVLESTAKQRSAELLADFENNLGSEYSFDDDGVWQKAKELADREVRRAQKVVASRCRELGIPDRFAPSLRLIWCHRGHDNLVESRKRELRLMAQTAIEAIEQKAIVQIKLSCLEAQTQIATASLTSNVAKQIIESLPSVESLMPALSYEEMAGEANPPIVEQLVSPGALRVRRFRERERALAVSKLKENVTPVTLPPPGVTPREDDGDEGGDDEDDA